MDTRSLGTLDEPELIALIVALSAQNAALAARVAALEAKLNITPKTPDNSSLPPSTGQKANRPETAKTSRKGRPGVSCNLEPNPDHVREVYAKIFRKVTNGFRSDWGAEVYADICSIVATGRLSGRTALAAITEALAAGALAVA